MIMEFILTQYDHFKLVITQGALSAYMHILYPLIFPILRNINITIDKPIVFIF